MGGQPSILARAQTAESDSGEPRQPIAKNLFSLCCCPARPPLASSWPPLLPPLLAPPPSCLVNCWRAHYCYTDGEDDYDDDSSDSAGDSAGDSDGDDDSGGVPLLTRADLTPAARANMDKHKTLLSLDGGGMRGLITGERAGLAVLMSCSLWDERV